MSNNPKREVQKIVKLAGRTWVIDKFDAFTGSYIAYKLLNQLLPGGIDAQIRGAESPSLPVMSKSEFLELQIDALSVVREKLASGYAPLIGENGGWGVMDVERNASLIIGLTIHSLIFNLSSFFEGDALKDLMSGLQGVSAMNPFTAPTSTNIPTPQS